MLLLEAGGEEPPQTDVPAFIPFNWETRFDWQFETEPDKDYCGGKPCIWNAGKVLGGGSVLNGMIYNRGNGRSYDKWKELGKGFHLLFDGEIDTSAERLEMVAWERTGLVSMTNIWIRKKKL